MNYLELINKCLVELNYKQVNTFSELTKNEHNKTGRRKNASPAGMKLAICLTLCEVLPRVECLKAFFHTGVVNAQELVLRGCHVDKIRLALAAFLVEELVHRLIYRRLL